MTGVVEHTQARTDDLLPALVATWRATAVVALAAALLGFGLSSLQPVEYSAEADLLLADPRNSGLFGESGVNFLDPSRYVRNQAEFAQSRTVIQRASVLLDDRLDAEEIVEQTTIRPSGDLDLLTIRATDATAGGAAQVANAIGEAYQAIVREQAESATQSSLDELNAQRSQLQEELTTVQEELADNANSDALQAQRDAAIQQLITIDGRIDQITVDAALFGSGVELFEPAEPPRSPSAPTPVRNAILAGLLGAMAAAAWAWWRAEETATADGRNDPSRVLHAPLLGTVPDFEEVGLDTSVPIVDAPKSPVGEAYQFLVGALAFALEETEGKSVVITSASPTDGKTVSCLNLAIAAAQDGREVLLVDADTRVRGLTRRLKADANTGLPGLADPNTRINDVVLPLVFDDRQSVPFIPARELGQDTAAFFRTPGFRRAMNRLTALADLVIIDSPPLLLASDASAIATNVDGIVVVVSRGTSMKAIAEMRERLDRIGTPVLGYIYTKAKLSGSGYGGYQYDYNYAFGYGESASDRRADPPRARRGRRGKKNEPVTDDELVA